MVPDCPYVIAAERHRELLERAEWRRLVRRDQTPLRRRAVLLETAADALQSMGSWLRGPGQWLARRTLAEEVSAADGARGPR